MLITIIITTTIRIATINIMIIYNNINSNHNNHNNKNNSKWFSCGFGIPLRHREKSRRKRYLLIIGTHFLGIIAFNKHVSKNQQNIQIMSRNENALMYCLLFSISY